MKQSKELTGFYNAYNDWLEAGAPKENEYEFERQYGLCGNLYFYTIRNKISTTEFKILKSELSKQFDISCLEYFYPFGKEEFDSRYFNNSQHLDPNRIRWVKSHLTEEVEEKFELI